MFLVQQFVFWALAVRPAPLPPPGKPLRFCLGVLLVRHHLLPPQRRSEEEVKEGAGDGSAGLGALHRR